jgi:adenylate cyclase
MLARVLSTRMWWAWSRNIDQDLTEGYLAAAQAATLDERDPYSQYALFLFSILTRRHDQALAQAQRSLDLSPNFSLGYFALGWIRIYIGHFPEAGDAILRSQRLNPNDPQSGAHLAIVGLAYYHQNDYKTALHYAEHGPRRRRHPLVLRTLLASLGQLGRIEEAHAILREMEQSGITAQGRYWEMTNPYLHDIHFAHLREGMIKAGLRV